MLSRVADNLYWFGRYVERTEHVSRFLRVQYFSSLEVQSDRQIDLALKSILSMVDIEHNEGKLLEEYALVSVAMDISIRCPLNHVFRMPVKIYGGQGTTSPLNYGRS